MVNKSTRPEIIANKWSRGSISMTRNEVVLVVSMDLQMDMNRGNIMDADEEGTK